MKKFKEYYLYFMMYAIIGWIYEVLLEAFVWHHGYVNRGVLFGPWLPVYGIGALIFLFTIYPLIKDKPLKRRLLLIPVIFILCMLAATLLELLTSYLCELTIGYIPWDYTNYKIQFQSRIALSTSIRFGIGGVVFLYLLQPLFEKIIKKLGDKKVNIVFYIIGSLFLVDLIVKLIRTIF